jgi:hypothetical protein
MSRFIVKSPAFFKGKRKGYPFKDTVNGNPDTFPEYIEEVKDL